MTRLAPALALVFCACSSSSPTTPSSAGVMVKNNGCALPTSGMYLAHFVDHGSVGGCGPVGDAILDISQATQGTCSGGSGSVTDDPVPAGGCKITANLMGCHQTNPAGATSTTSTNGTYTWSADYSTATSTLMVTLVANGQSCSDVYDVTLTKQ